MDVGLDGRQIGVRVIRLGIWKDLLEIDWCRYLAARSQSVTEVEPPMLTNHNQRVVYFTDIPSISCCFHAEDLAERLTLAHIDRFRDEGALVVYFPLAEVECRIPAEGGVPAPLTDGGARQWIAMRNIPFSEEAMITEVLPPAQDDEPFGPSNDPFGSGSSWHRATSHEQESTTDSRWNYSNPKLADPAYWERVIHAGSTSGSFVPSDREELEAYLDGIGE